MQSNIKKSRIYYRNFPSNIDDLSKGKSKEKLIIVKEINIRSKKLLKLHNEFRNTNSSPLAILSCIPAINKAIKSKAICLIIADTGSGKTTIIPQIILNQTFNHESNNKKIICIQPKRLATILASHRVSSEISNQARSLVGYKIQFEDTTTLYTKIKFATNGIFIKECTNLKNIQIYSHIIIDEIHERTVSTDVILGLLNNILRLGIRVILMSATLDIRKIFMLFPNSSILKIKGRSYPIIIKWRRSFVDNYYYYVDKTLDKIHNIDKEKNTLVFFPGEEDIELMRCIILKKLFKYNRNNIQILPLYSRLNKENQLLAVNEFSKNTYKWIFATNIAETSITIKDITYVIDTGYNKVKMYTPNFLCSTLKIQLISKSSAIQRAGRSGRTKSGLCFRLYTRNFFFHLMRSSINPEIKRSDLSSIILFFKSLKNHNYRVIELVDFPPITNIRSSLFILWILNLIDNNCYISKEGVLVNKFPLDVFQTKLLLNSVRFKCSYECISIVALLNLKENSQKKIHNRKLKHF
mmetsp:Transcript_3847/g.9092  ORF Transcript_3847/g.9092 Transcript_3847/m.9092 type:complete len:524 (+) Transcript_3847:151-1722(+)